MLTKRLQLLQLPSKSTWVIKAEAQSSSMINTKTGQIAKVAKRKNPVVPPHASRDLSEIDEKYQE